MSAVLRLTRLKLADFRNHAALDLRFSDGPVILTGANGAGKTNILEAVSLLTPGRGLRQAGLETMARQEGPGIFAVYAELDGPYGTFTIGTGTLADAPERRQVRIDGQIQTSISSLGRHVRVLWLTPAMDRLFAEAPSGRRRFLDRLALALDPDHADHAAAYERAMRQRNRVLREAKVTGRGADGVWLDGLERQMAEAGIALAAGRRALIARLQARLVHHDDAVFPKPDLTLDGSLETALGVQTAVQAEDAFALTLAKSRGLDQEAGRALHGPHTSDLLVRHVVKDQSADLCSTGEQKALLISILLAQADDLTAEGLAPLLLLDEVAAHLDPRRRAALFERLRGLGLQAWMTGTEDALFEECPGPANRIAVGG